MIEVKKVISYIGERKKLLLLNCHTRADGFYLIQTEARSEP